MRYVLTKDAHQCGDLIPVYRSLVSKVDSNWSAQLFRSSGAYAHCLLDRDAFIDLPLSDAGLIVDNDEVRVVAHMAVPAGHSLHRRSFDLVCLDGYADRETAEVHPVGHAHADIDKVIAVERTLLTPIDERHGYYYVTAHVQGRVVGLLGPLESHLQALFGLARARERLIEDGLFAGSDYWVGTNRLDPAVCKVPPDGILEAQSTRRILQGQAA